MRYVKPNTLRNTLYSVAIAVVAWHVCWLFWLHAFPKGGARLVRSRTVFVFSPRSVAAGVTWSPALFALPNKNGFSSAAREGDPRLVACLKPKTMPPEFLEEVPGMAASRSADGSGEWEREVRGEGREARYEPVPVEGLAYGRPASEALGLFISVERLDGWQDHTLVLPEEVPARLVGLDGRWLAMTAHVVAGARGRVAHVLMETSSGSEEADRVLVKALYAAQVKGPEGLAPAGHVRISVAGRRGI